MSSVHQLALRCHVARLWRINCSQPSRSRAQPCLAPPALGAATARPGVDCRATQGADATTRTLATSVVLAHRGEGIVVKTIFNKKSVVGDHAAGVEAEPKNNEEAKKLKLQKQQELRKQHGRRPQSKTKTSSKNYDIFGVSMSGHRTRVKRLKDHLGLAQHSAEQLAKKVPFINELELEKHKNAPKVVKVLSKWKIDVAKVLSKNLMVLHVPARQVSKTLNGLQRAGFANDDIARFAEANPDVLAWPANMDSLTLMKALGIASEHAGTKITTQFGGNSRLTPFGQLTSAVQQCKQVRRIEPELEARYMQNGARLREQDVDLTALNRGYHELLAEDPAVIEEKMHFLSERPLYMTMQQRAVFLTRGTSIFTLMSLDTARANLTELSRFVPEKELGALVETTPSFLRPGAVQFLDILSKFGIASANLSDMLLAPTWMKARHRPAREYVNVSHSEFDAVLPARYELLRHYFDREQSLDILGDVGCYLCHPRLAPGALHVRLRLLEHIGAIEDFGRESFKRGKRVADRTIAGSIKATPPKFAAELGMPPSYIYYFNEEYGRLYESKGTVSAMEGGGGTSTWANIGLVTKKELRKGIKSFKVWEAEQSKQTSKGKGKQAR